jgi:glucan-binding YG repeat protein
LPSESSINTDSESGDYVYTNNSKYEVNEVEWITSDDREMKIGYQPKLKVTLRATDSDEYAFKGGYRSSNVSIKGGTYVSSHRSGSDTLYVTLRFNPIKGTYESPDDAYWKDSGYGHARWDSVENSSDAYDVFLYRGSNRIKKVEGLKATSYNFYPYMTKSGTYTFKVRTVPYTESQKKYGKKSDWIESNEMYLPKEEVSNGSGQENDAPASTQQVGWIKNGNNWYYRYPDRTYQKNSWAKLQGKWYLFGTDGSMITGWKQKNNIWYYMNNDGSMATAWIQSNNKKYFLNPSTTSGIEGAMSVGWIMFNNKWYFADSTGAIVKGWYEVNGNWYYFYPEDGSMAVNTSISGFKVDASGVWHKK